MYLHVIIVPLALMQGPMPAPDCLEDATRPAAVHLCRAEQHLRRFKAELRRQPDNDRWLQLAIKELQSAAERGRGTPDFVVALQRLIDLYTPWYTNDPSSAESLLHWWIEASPTDIGPRLELFAVREANGQLDVPRDIREIHELADPTSSASTQLAAFREKWRQPAPILAGQVVRPVLVKYVLPAYPDEARKAGLQGIVIIEAEISETGKVVGAKVLRSIPLLDEAALEAVRQWEYEPTIVKGRAVSVTATISVTFTLGAG